MAGGGLLPAYVRGPLDERLRVIPEPPVAGRRLVVVRGEPGTGTAACWARARATSTAVRPMWVTIPSASLPLGARTKAVPFTIAPLPGTRSRAITD